MRIGFERVMCHISEQVPYFSRLAKQLRIMESVTITLVFVLCVIIGTIAIVALRAFLRVSPSFRRSNEHWRNRLVGHGH